jgi:iron-sulfur cluster assembly accessory protein
MAQLEATPVAREVVPDLTPDMPSPIALTAKAVEMAKKARDDEGLGGYGLRIGVIGGGCSGLQYLLDFAEKPTDEDFVSSQHGLSVFIDPFSAAHLSGTEIDYVDSLTTSGFKFNNPNVQRACGCGSSFST